MSDNINTIELQPISLSNINYSTQRTLEENSGNIKSKHLCIRPSCKYEYPKVFISKVNNRVIGNNYGHGGNGWSLLWGSVNHTVELVSKEVNIVNNKIAVIGSGCIGYGTVFELLSRGVPPENIELFTDKLNNLTSHNAGALFSTASITTKLDIDSKTILDKMTLSSFKKWKSIYEGEYFPELKKGIEYLDTYFGDEDKYGAVYCNSGIEILEEKGLIPKAEKVFLNFNNKKNRFRKTKTFFFNTEVIMDTFYFEINKKIKINMKQIKDYSDIPNTFSVIFNCCGLGNKYYLNKDQDIFPRLGHVIKIKGELFNRNYIIYSYYLSYNDYIKGNKPELFYYFPKYDSYKTYYGLIGGSYMENYIGDNEILNEEEYLKIINKARDIFGIEDKMIKF